MKLALAYPRRTVDKFGWVAAAFRRQGHEVQVVRTLDELRAADRDCDVVLFEHRTGGLEQNAVAEMAESRSAVWCEWIFDLMAIERDKPIEEQLWLARPDGEPNAWMRALRKMDIVFVKERSMLDDWKNAGVEARYLDQGCPREMPACDLTADPEWDVLFWGRACGKQGYWAQRYTDVAELVDAGLKVAWCTRDSEERVPRGVEILPWTHPFDLPEVASRAVVTLGVDARDDVVGYVSDRFWLACGMGACHVHRVSPMVGCYAPECTDLYRSTDRVVQYVEKYRASRWRRIWQGKLLRASVMRRHTYDDRVVSLLGALDEWKYQWLRIPRRSSVAPVAAAAR